MDWIRDVPEQMGKFSNSSSHFADNSLSFSFGRSPLSSIYLDLVISFAFIFRLDS